MYFQLNNFLSPFTQYKTGNHLMIRIFKKSLFIILFGTLLLTLLACAPEIGSDKWCTSIKEKPKADLTANEIGNFTKHCILK